jgi:hypothetical protein
MMLMWCLRARMLQGSCFSLPMMTRAACLSGDATLVLRCCLRYLRGVARRIRISAAGRILTDDRNSMSPVRLEQVTVIVMFLRNAGRNRSSTRGCNRHLRTTKRAGSGQRSRALRAIHFTGFAFLAAKTVAKTRAKPEPV